MGNIIDKIPIINRIGNKKPEMPPVFENYEGIEDIVNKSESGIDGEKEIDVNVLISEIPNPRTINTPGELTFFTDRFKASYDNFSRIKKSEDKSRFADALHERLQRAIYLGKYWKNASEVENLRDLSELSLRYRIGGMDKSGVKKDPVIQ